MRVFSHRSRRVESFSNGVNQTRDSILCCGRDPPGTELSHLIETNFGGCGAPAVRSGRWCFSAVTFKGQHIPDLQKRSPQACRFCCALVRNFEVLCYYDAPLPTWF